MPDMVLLSYDEAADRHVPQQARQAERLEQEWPAWHRIPFNDDDLGIDAGALELGGQAAGRAADAPEVVRRIAVIAAPGDKADVRTRVHGPTGEVISTITAVLQQT